MLDSNLFPESARFCYVITDRRNPDLQNYLGLHPLEQALVSHSVDIRKAEFGDARWCAHQALRDLGQWDNEPILRGERGMPLWPQDITGSMTHTEGFRAAVVAPKTHVRSMGLDAEPAEPLPPEVIGSIARPGEMPQLERLRSEGIDCADRLLFCAKEATYKAWFPMTYRWLGFEDAEIDIRSDGTFISYLLTRPTPVPFIAGRWMVRDGYVIAATAVT
ncbi:4'-phosphopantetheinyl transferase [Corynebacterium sp. YIM 101645]|uniref:4'-phosphopantetheinyl transferase n=1 Tax=Corynebacterium lemuris TaxID=1859292 RepID=A0ABT2FWM9_9CORY|nr:4'-phosphopantetheinyl transferase [Corynebacterium lemuris]MCS5479210.1 4'-phosphopantetheinyl transferase [Corynebacterium lemuris]